MGMARFLVEAHVLEGRPVSELAAAHGVHRSWIYKLLVRYREGGYAALESRSRRPKSCKHATSDEIVRAIVTLRERLGREGHDAGAHTISHHLVREIEGDVVPSVSTIWRILRREGLVVRQPQKRPASSLIRFQADLPNEMWQADITHWRLAEGTDVEILNTIDDHSRLFLASQAFKTVKAVDVVEVFHKATQLHGLPASLLTDNGAVFTGFYRKGKVLLEAELERLGIEYKNSRPYHPQTCGKIERLHQTLKRYLDRQPAAPGHSQNSRSSSTRSRTTTTLSAPTGHSTAAHRCRHTTHGSRPGQPAPPLQTPISASGKTRSTPTEPSRCAT